MWVVGVLSLTSLGCRTPEIPVDDPPSGTPEVRTEPVPQRCMVSTQPIDGNTALTYVHQGKIYFFCSQKCIELFKEDPEGYLKAVARSSRRK